MILFLIWLCGVIVLLYPIYSAILKGVSANEPSDTEDKIATIFISTLIVIVWPLVLVGLGMFLTSHRIWRGFWIPKWMKPTPQDAVQQTNKEI